MTVPTTVQKLAAVNRRAIGDTQELNIEGHHLKPCYEPSMIDALESGQEDAKPVLTRSFPITGRIHATSAALPGDVLKELVISV